MLNKKIVICGAGDTARDFLDYKPNDCQVKYIVDSDVNKLGTKIHGIEIFNRKHLEEEKENIVVLLTFNDSETEKWLESLKVEWYRSYGEVIKISFVKKKL